MLIKEAKTVEELREIVSKWSKVKELIIYPTKDDPVNQLSGPITQNMHFILLDHNGQTMYGYKLPGGEYSEK